MILEAVSQFAESPSQRDSACSGFDVQDCGNLIVLQYREEPERDDGLFPFGKFGQRLHDVFPVDRKIGRQ